MGFWAKLWAFIKSRCTKQARIQDLAAVKALAPAAATILTATGHVGGAAIATTLGNAASEVAEKIESKELGQ